MNQMAETPVYCAQDGPQYYSDYNHYNGEINDLLARGPDNLFQFSHNFANKLEARPFGFSSCSSFHSRWQVTLPPCGVDDYGNEGSTCAAQTVANHSSCSCW